MYAAADVADWLSGLVTETLTEPAEPAGSVHVSCVALVTLTLAQGFPPTLTLAPVRNPAPSIVTGPPPATGPLTGSAVVMAGAGEMKDVITGSPEDCPTATYCGPEVTERHTPVVPLVCDAQAIPLVDVITAPPSPTATN